MRRTCGSTDKQTTRARLCPLFRRGAFPSASSFPLRSTTYEAELCCAKPTELILYFVLPQRCCGHAVNGALSVSPSISVSSAKAPGRRREQAKWVQKIGFHLFAHSCENHFKVLACSTMGRGNLPLPRYHAIRCPAYGGALNLPPQRAKGARHALCCRHANEHRPTPVWPSLVTHLHRPNYRKCS